MSINFYEAVNPNHGIRANHKDFQCAIEENLASGFPKAEVVQQDINQVFLNLANNAFYAMREKVQKNREEKPRKNFYLEER
ncbi:MAG: hypothetical protein IPP46_18145 [Bacteroidetes bacterium]|nr:hypothetical protein [Bacteroidota bacterium]